MAILSGDGFLFPDSFRYRILNLVFELLPNFTVRLFPQFLPALGYDLRQAVSDQVYKLLRDRCANIFALFLERFVDGLGDCFLNS
jgi:hypothetical protein